MAIYHLEAKVVSRGAGRSAVAASAYLSCSRLYNDYDGIQHDYTRKQGLVWQEVFLPEYAPQEWQDREKLWNAVEKVETAKDSRLAREFVVTLPIELSREQQIELLQEFIREQFVSDGMCADAAIHDTDGHTPHAHILLTVRPLDEQGHWQYKTEKEYLCVKNGEERGFTAAEFKTAQNEGWEKDGFPYQKGGEEHTVTASFGESDGFTAGQATRKLTVEKWTLTAEELTVTLPQGAAYDGSEKTASAQLSKGNWPDAGMIDLQYYQGTTKLAAAQKAAGTYTVKLGIAGNDYYNAAELSKAEWTFTIAPANPTVSSEPQANDLTYTGGKQSLVSGGAAANGTILYSLEKDGAYESSVPQGQEAGDYTVYWYVKGNENYSDGEKKQIAVTIKAKSLKSSDMTAEDVAEQTYNGGGIEPGVTVKDAGTALKLGTEYTVAYKDNENAGTATVTITGKGNYQGSTEKTFTIRQAAITVTELSGIRVTKVYDGSTDAGTLTGTVGFSGRYGSGDVSVAAEAGAYADANAGENKRVTLTFTLRGAKKENYVLARSSAEFDMASITQADGAVDAPTGKRGLRYNGQEQ